MTSFFDRWHVYALIIGHNYMWHREIHDAIRESLLARPAGFSVLDLGCGDASDTAETLRGLPVGKYTGVDSSEAALAEARRNFADSGFDLSFIQSDFGEFLTAQGSGSVDVVIAGYSAHHLQDHEKPEFLSRCLARLDEGGVLFYYDVFRRAGESRDRYLDAYARLIERQWHALSHDQKSSVIDHIREFDFPGEYDDLAKMAAEAGLETPRAPLFTDEEGLHRLYEFRKPV